MIYLVILITMTLFGAIAAYFLKKVSESESLMDTLKSKYLYFGGGLYVTAAVLNIYLFRFLDYSVVLPLTAMTYILTMLISYKYLGEKITKRKIFGILMIIGGSVFIGMS